MRIKNINFLDQNQKIVFQYKLTSLPLSEKFIIRKSIELFNDSEPCVIHRSFVMKKLFFEIDSYFDQMLTKGKNKIRCSEILKEIYTVLDIPDEIYEIQLV
ncbi:MAG: hypothetical protein N2645_01335 [Clostridia bacterium]|nr:hypothetical protein [Clostridia bacterium]